MRTWPAIVCPLTILLLVASAALRAAPIGPDDFKPGAEGYSLDNPLPTMDMPFQRVGDPFQLPATTTPQQYQVNQPANTKSYRGVNPCTVDIRIRTVGSMSETVTPTTGRRILARTAEPFASSPAKTTPRIVSIMTLGDPGQNGCTFELEYGNGG